MENGNIEKAMHELIRGLSETKSKCENLTSGYIGNFESWGDDRDLHVWADGKVFWACRADKLDATTFNNLIQKLNAKYDLDIKEYSQEATFKVDADSDPDCYSGPGM